MNVVKDFLLMAAGLIITVSLAMMGFKIYRGAESTGNAIVQREQKRFEDFTDYELTKYEGLEVSGSKIVRYVKELSSEYDTDVYITVRNGDSNRNFTYLLEDAEGWQDLRDTSSDYYINPLKKFTVKVLKDDNDMLQRVVIAQKEEN